MIILRLLMGNEHSRDREPDPTDCVCFSQAWNECEIVVTGIRPFLFLIFSQGSQYLGTPTVKKPSLDDIISQLQMVNHTFLVPISVGAGTVRMVETEAMIRRVR